METGFLGGTPSTEEAQGLGHVKPRFEILLSPGDNLVYLRQTRLSPQTPDPRKSKKCMETGLFGGTPATEAQGPGHFKHCLNFYLPQEE